MITRDAPKLGWFAKSLLGLAVLFPLCICGLFFGWPTGGGKEASKKSSCQSNLKQIISGAQIYASDNNDAMPPFYSFEGTEPATRFRGALNPYLKSDEVYLCLLDDTVWGPGDERGQMRKAMPGAMSHVHPYSLKWVVPDFLAGNRILKESDIKAPEKTPYMRDPLRFGPDGAYSYHGKGIMTGYLDGHVRYKIPVDDKADF